MLYNSPFIKPQLLANGVPAYFFGSLNMLKGNGRGTVQGVAIAANVATVAVTVDNGPLPAINDLVTIWATASGAGEFNVFRALVTGVSFNTATNAGTVTFALTGTNLGTTTDSGMVLFEPGEQPETLTTNTFSVPVAVQSPRGDSQFTLPLAVTFPSLPTAATVTLQVAIRDIASEYTNTTTVVTVAAGAYTAGPVVQATLQRGYVYRLAVTGVTGGSAPSLIAKVG
jgi:hypothetical protein